MDFDRERQKRFGERGNPIFEREQQTTDVEEMKERTVETFGFCYCGDPITDRSDVYRCVACDLICCQSCRVQITNQTFCSTCVQQGYDLNKQTFLQLYLVSKDLVSVEDLIEIRTGPDGDVLDLEIDEAVTPLLVNGYLAEDESLTPFGQEALEAGRQLYGDDNDIAQIMQEVRIEEVADR